MDDRETPPVERRHVEPLIEPGSERDHRRDGRICGDVNGHGAAHRETEKRDLTGARCMRSRDPRFGVLDAELEAAPRLDPVAHFEKSERRMERPEPADEPFERSAPGTGNRGGRTAVHANDRAGGAAIRPAPLGAAREFGFRHGSGRYP
ncbi:MAG: hypothetical protein MSC30_16680 [Gaiellaceae bacterium MAG52_C11]|nr:hypothetical protein [Candidatus Gaiellasilicea maunaloa]